MGSVGWGRWGGEGHDDDVGGTEQSVTERDHRTCMSYFARYMYHCYYLSHRAFVIYHIRHSDSSGLPCSGICISHDRRVTVGIGILSAFGPWGIPVFPIVLSK